MHNDHLLLSNNNLFDNSCYISTNDVLLEPRTGVLASRKDAILNSKFLFSSPMDTVTDYKFSQSLLEAGGNPIFCRFLDPVQKTKALVNLSSHENFWYSVGASEEDFHSINNFIKNSKTPISLNIAVDVAHGDTLPLHNIYKLYSKAPWCKNLMSGTIATSSAAQKLYNLGCNYLRVGIGPGSACTTRIVTGCGVPNLSAVFDIWSSFQSSSDSQKPIIIADGGIKTTGDIIKYLAAGADAVMIGSLFSDCKESAGWNINLFKYILNKITFNFFFKNYLFKKYRGQASASFQNDYRGQVSGTPEGVTGPVKYPTKHLKNFVTEINAGIASAISYLGLTNIKDINPRNVKFLKISSASYKESRPHLLE